MSEFSQETGEESGKEPGIEEVPWIGQAPLEIYLDELHVARNDPEVASLVRLNWETLERLGEVDHVFLKKVARNYHYRFGPFTIQQWWERVEGERRYLILEAASRRKRQTFTEPVRRSSAPAASAKDASGACDEILDAWEVHPPLLRHALEKVRSMSSEPNTTEFRCLVRLVGWISAKYLDSPADLREVADEVVRAYLAGAASLASVKGICERGKTHATNAFSELFAGTVCETIEKNIVLLLDSGEGRAVAKLSANLRRYGRSDLSIEATEGYGVLQDGGTAVCTSRAAALADLERLDEALELCRSIWSVKPNDAVCTVKSRTLRLKRNNEESHRWALEGWGLEQNRYTARTLAASSALVGDMAHLQAAAKHLEWSEMGLADSEQVDPLVLVKAGWVLLNDGNIEQAMELARRVQKEHGGYRPAGALLNAAHQRDFARHKTSQQTS